MIDIDDFSEIVYTLGESLDNGRAAFGDQWGDTITFAYNEAVEHLLPQLPLADHDRFTSALFCIRSVVHSELGMDVEPSS